MNWSINRMLVISNKSVTKEGIEIDWEVGTMVAELKVRKILVSKLRLHKLALAMKQGIYRGIFPEPNLTPSLTSEEIFSPSPHPWGFPGGSQKNPQGMAIPLRESLSHISVYIILRT